MRRSWRRGGGWGWFGLTQRNLGLLPTEVRQKIYSYIMQTADDLLHFERPAASGEIKPLSIQNCKIHLRLRDGHTYAETPAAKEQLQLLLKADDWIRKDATNHFFSDSDAHTFLVDYEHANHWLTGEPSGVYHTWSTFGMLKPQSQIYANRSFYLANLVEVSIDVISSDLQNPRCIHPVARQLASREICPKLESVHLDFTVENFYCSGLRHLETVADGMPPFVNRGLSSYTMDLRLEMLLCDAKEVFHNYQAAIS